MFASYRKSPFVLFLLLTCCAVPSIAQGQSPDPAQASPGTSPVLSSRARKQLQDKLESAATTPLMVVPADGSPVEINGAKAQSLKIEGNCDLPADHGAIINDHVVKLRLKLVNHASQVITGVGLEFTNTHEDNTFYVYPKLLKIEPGKSQKFEIAFMALTGDPAYLSVKLVGAGFASGDTWGGFPLPNVRHTRGALGPSAAAPGLVAQVDSRPRVVTTAAPHYTEDARRNYVSGVVVVGLLVGADGTVKQAKVSNELPDGLTEQALLACYRMKFEPARKNGEPVPFWLQRVEVEFNLR